MAKFIEAKEAEFAAAMLDRQRQLQKEMLYQAKQEHYNSYWGQKPPTNMALCSLGKQTLEAMGDFDGDIQLTPAQYTAAVAFLTAQGIYGLKGNSFGPQTYMWRGHKLVNVKPQEPQWQVKNNQQLQVLKRYLDAYQQTQGLTGASLAELLSRKQR